MEVIGRIFIVLWTIIFIVLWIGGGFFIAPVIGYICTGDFDDPVEFTEEVYCYVKDKIEDAFDGDINIKKSNFWK